MIDHRDLTAYAISVFGAANHSEADLRRAVSALYYALFHRLASSGAALFGKGGQRLEDQVSRAFNHLPMRSLCEAYVKPPATRQPSVLDRLAPDRDPDISIVCDAFVALQAARHRADYDLAATLTVQEAVLLWATSDRAHRAWSASENRPAATTFLAALLLHDKWTRRG